MKFKKILLSLVAIITAFFVTTVKADAPNSFVISASNLTMLYGSNYLGNGSTLNFTYKTNTAGKVVYCTEIHDSMTSGTETYTLSRAADAKFAYVLANGYPNKSITGSSYKDYYITGLALWYLISPNDSVFTYFNLSAGTYKGSSSQIVKEVAKLVNAAKNYSYVEPSIKIQNATNNFTLSSDKKYYVSNQLSVTATGGVSTFYMSLSNAPAGSIITDVNGNAKTDTNGTAKEGLKVGEKFLVKIPASSIKALSTSLTVNVSGTGSINKAYIYSPSVAAHQSLITLYPQNKTVADHAPLKLDITTSVEISKQDATTGKELPGATLVLSDASGKEVAKWVSTTEPKVIKNLQPGKYTLSETSAPKGYKLTTQKITFEIKADGTVDKQIMKNYPEDKVYISKEDATTGKELPGATLVLTDSNGKQVDKWVSGTTAHLIEGLKPGKYTLTETIAPKGYILNTNKVTFEVDKDGKVSKPVIMVNYPEGKTNISKQDATTGKELPGATLVLTDSNGKQVDKWVSTDTPHKVEGLKPGKYILTETIAPKGYILSTEKVEFTVTKEGKVTDKPIMKNYPEGTTNISKEDATTGKELPGATLVIKDEKGKVIDKWVSTDTPHKVEGLKPGKYTLTETIAPDGYRLSTETIEFTVTKEGKVKDKITMKNYPEGSVLISKQDITTGKELYGAHLEVRDEKGNLVEAWVSGKEPHLIASLEPGKYTLTETIAPDGYELSTEKVEFVVNENGKVDDMVIMYNKPTPAVPVPKTSSFKTMTTSIIGIIIMSLGAMIIMKNYKKNEE